METIRIDDRLIRTLLPPRRAESHKGDYGRALLVCGAMGYTGAPYFAATGAVRSGAGLVDLAIPEPIWAVEAGKMAEAMVHPLPANAEGMVSTAAIRPLLKRLASANVLLAGCGMGRSADVEQVVCALLDAARVPVILDADGINAVARHKDKIRNAAAPVVLTPHMGELRRLLGEDVVKDGESRAEAAVRIAADWNVILVMKGHRTLVADPTGRVYENTTGNPGMARGGSGDALAGILAGLLAQGIPPTEAAAAAVYLHGLAGDLARDDRGEIGMTVTDLLDRLPDAFVRCRGI